MIHNDLELKLITVYFVFFFIVMATGSVALQRLAKKWDSETLKYLAFLCCVFTCMFVIPACAFLFYKHYYPLAIFSLILVGAALFSLINSIRYQLQKKQ